MSARVNINLTSAFIMAVLIFLAYYATKSNKYTNYVSHSFEPSVGSEIVNNNLHCKHYKSCGIVTNIKALDGDMGKVVTYRVTNNGNTYANGDLLNKTMDEIQPKM